MRGTIFVMSDRSKYFANYRAERRDLLRKQSIAARKKAAAFLLKLKAKPCHDCKKKYPPCVMDFHHLKPSDKTYNIAKLTSIALILKEAAKCILLCANCHRLRTHAR